MAVFTALRNKAQSAASGFLTKTATSALGLDRAKGLRFPSSSTSPVTGGPTTNRGGQVLQYPLDLGSDGNSHFIAFFVKTVTPATIEVVENDGTTNTAAKARKNVTKILMTTERPLGLKKLVAQIRLTLPIRKVLGVNPICLFKKEKDQHQNWLKLLLYIFHHQSNNHTT